jgi:hypothetical protein
VISDPENPRGGNFRKIEKLEKFLPSLSFTITK